MKVEEFVKKFKHPTGFTKELSTKEWATNDNIKLLTIKNADDSICFSNVASFYIIKGKEKVFLRDGEVQTAVERALIGVIA